MSQYDPCPHCGEYARTKYGFTKNTGYQRYECSSCGKYSSDSPYPKGSELIGDEPKPTSIRAMGYRAAREQK